MSDVSIQAALETALKAMNPSWQEEQWDWENSGNLPIDDVPCQRVNMLPGEPENPVATGGFYRAVGTMQVDLGYPTEVGSGPAGLEYERIKNTFYQGATFQAGGVAVIIHRTPSKGPSWNAEGRYWLPVRVRYFANIFS